MLWASFFQKRYYGNLYNVRKFNVLYKYLKKIVEERLDREAVYYKHITFYTYIIIARVIEMQMNKYTIVYLIILRKNLHKNIKIRLTAKFRFSVLKNSWIAYFNSLLKYSANYIKKNKFGMSRLEKYF